MQSRKVHIAFGYDDGEGWNYGFCVDDMAFDNVADNIVSITSASSSCLESTFVGNVVDGLVNISNYWCSCSNGNRISCFSK